MIAIACPSCNGGMQIEENEANTEWECPSCNAAFRVQKDNTNKLRFVMTEGPSPNRNSEITADPYFFAIDRLTKGDNPQEARGKLVQLGLTFKQADEVVVTASRFKKEKEAREKVIEDLRKRFPDLVPVDTVPSLTMFNGIGFSVWGDRDNDTRTGTYVTTVFLFVLFVPIFAFGAYRVAEASPEEAHLLGRVHAQSFRFYGRVPMSIWAKAFNWIVFLTIVGVISYCWWKF